MSVSLVCPTCCASWDVDSSLAGKSVLCPECRERIRVPSSVAIRPIALPAWLEKDAVEIAPESPPDPPQREITVRFPPSRRKPVIPLALIVGASIFVFLGSVFLVASAIRPSMVEADKASAVIGYGQVRVTQVAIGSLEYTRLGIPFESKDRFVKITLSIDNVSPDKKFDFLGWGKVDRQSGAFLRDDIGNHYRPFVYGITTSVPGQQDSVTLYPGAHVTDMLVFEQPVAAANDLYLTLDKEHLGPAGKVLFRIPKSMIVNK